MRLIRRAARHAVGASWRFTAFVTAGHATSAAVGLLLLGETALVASVTQFAYFYIVTGSSVGYGDFSPSSDAGKLFTALWVIPGAISIFAFVVGKIIGEVSMGMRKIMNGHGDFSDKTGHLVIIGWVEGHTARLLEETRHLHGARDVVIVSSHDLSGVRAGWDWIRASSLASASDLRRSGILGADFIVILAESDDESLTASLAIGAMELRGHCVAFFADPAPADLIETHCPTIETVTSNTIEQVARSLSDPGASDLLRRLVSTRAGATLYSTKISAPGGITVQQAMASLLDRYGATLIGYRPSDGADPIMAMRPDTELARGQTIYYIAGTRLPAEVDLAATQPKGVAG